MPANTLVSLLQQLMNATVLAESSFIFQLDSLRYTDVYRCESGRCRTLPFFLTFFTKKQIERDISNSLRCYELLHVSTIFWEAPSLSISKSYSLFILISFTSILLYFGLYCKCTYMIFSLSFFLF